MTKKYFTDQISYTSETSTINSTISKLIRHKRKRITSTTQKDIFTSLINPFLSELITQINILSGKSISYIPTTFPQFQNSIPNNPMNHFEDNETFIDENFPSMDDKLYIKEYSDDKTNDIKIDNIIYDKVFGLKLEEEFSSLDDFFDNEHHKKIKEVLNLSFELIEKFRNIRRIMERENISMSSLFTLSGKTYYILNKEMKDLIVRLTESYDIKLICDIMNTSAKSIKRWKKLGTVRKKGAGRKIIDPQMEGKLLKWYKRVIKKGGKITSSQLREKALEFSHNENFLASRGWFHKFRAKNGLIMSSQRKPKKTCK